MKNPTFGLILGLMATSCATTDEPLEDYEELTPTRTIQAPGVTPDPASAYTPDQVAHGQYLVELIGCAVCHTDGALAGERELGDWLAGSDVGIAFSNPMENKDPGVVFPSNLTPDPKTGIGRWSDEDLVAAIRQGVDRHGRRLIQVMPWLIYETISDDDAQAIVAYLRSLPPIENRVPDNVPAGVKTNELFVHFGVYRSRR